MLTTPTGLVWIGYFDEGIYGPDPLAHHGIACYDADLRPNWAYPFDTPVGQVHDCYSLNVDVETAWSCFYSNFPIVRIRDQVVTGWRSNLRGATALLASGDTCAVITGYQRPRATIGQLTDGRYESASERLIVVPDAANRLTMIGRRSELHVFAGTAWYRIALDDLT